MLIRVIIENCLSYADRTEFNMLPRPKIKSHPSHVYSKNNIKLLNLSAIYGANASGKSNLIKLLFLLKHLITQGTFPQSYSETRFKLTEKSKKQLIAVEFIKNGKVFYYAIEFSGRVITTEELYILDIKNSAHELLFERKTENSKTSISFNERYESDVKIGALRSILTEEFLNDDSCAFNVINKLKIEKFRFIKQAFSWFETDLNIIIPESRVAALPLRLEKDPHFKKFINDILCAFDLGLNSIGSEKLSFDEFIKEQDKTNFEKLINHAKEKIFGVIDSAGKEIVIERNDDSYFVRQLFFDHFSYEKQSVRFYYNDESDGTKRLLDLIPAIYDILNSQKSFIIDEIERSIHPILMKEILKKISHETGKQGQLIFTTHESVLLDQDIFRQDEIWFAEKNLAGVSSLYPLSDFMEHKTIDIRKGYLNGRYGSIPILSDLRELNWTANDNNA